MNKRVATFLLTATAMMASMASFAQQKPLDARDLKDKKKDKFRTTLHVITLPRTGVGIMKSGNLQSEMVWSVSGSGYEVAYIPVGDGIRSVTPDEITENMKSDRSFRNITQTNILIDGNGYTKIDTVNGKAVIEDRGYSLDQQDKTSVADVDELYAAIANGRRDLTRTEIVPACFLLSPRSAIADLQAIAKYGLHGDCGIVPNAAYGGGSKRDSISSIYDIYTKPIANGESFIESQITFLPFDDVTKPLPPETDITAFFVYNDRGVNRVAAFSLRELGENYENVMETMTEPHNEMEFLDHKFYHKKIKEALDNGTAFKDMTVDLQLTMFAFLFEKMRQSNNFLLLLDRQMKLVDVHSVDPPASTTDMATKTRYKIDN